MCSLILKVTKQNTVRKHTTWGTKPLGIISLTPCLSQAHLPEYWTTKFLPFSFLEGKFVLNNRKLIKTRNMALDQERFDRQGQDEGCPADF